MSSLTENGTVAFIQCIVSIMTYDVLSRTLNPTVNITVAIPPVDSCDEMRLAELSIASIYLRK